MKILHFADLHLGVSSYGHIDSTTGLPSRLHDFLITFDQVINYALENSVDLVLFCGDAYKSREPSQTQQREFAKRINHLTSNNIPIFLLIGNHDLPNAIGRATSTEIFHTLSIKNVHVANRPEIHRIQTKSGPIQISALPWLRRSALIGKDDSRNLNFEQLVHLAREVLTGIITKFSSQLDNNLPSILAAHIWIHGAKIGSENSMTIGQEHTLLLSDITNPAFDYIALGHIHRHQVLVQKPPVVYAGSLERLDFGDVDDEKGFYVVEIDGDNSGKKQTSFTFHPVTNRKFHIITCTVDAKDDDPTSTVIKAVMAQRGQIRDTIIRVQISLPSTQETNLRDADIRKVLHEAYHVTIAKEVQRTTRLRIGNITPEELTPLEALAKYIASKKDLNPEQAKLIHSYGSKLIKEQLSEDTT